jgi:hypothetical protein
MLGRSVRPHTILITPDAFGLGIWGSVCSDANICEWMAVNIAALLQCLMAGSLWSACKQCPDSKDEQDDLDDEDWYRGEVREALYTVSDKYCYIDIVELTVLAQSP